MNFFSLHEVKYFLRIHEKEIKEKNIIHTQHRSIKIVRRAVNLHHQHLIPTHEHTHLYACCLSRNQYNRSSRTYPQSKMWWLSKSPTNESRSWWKARTNQSSHSYSFTVMGQYFYVCIFFSFHCCCCCDCCKFTHTFARPILFFSSLLSD